MVHQLQITAVLQQQKVVGNENVLSVASSPVRCQEATGLQVYRIMLHVSLGEESPP